MIITITMVYTFRKPGMEYSRTDIKIYFFMAFSPAVILRAGIFDMRPVLLTVRLSVILRQLHFLFGGGDISSSAFIAG